MQLHLCYKKMNPKRHRWQTTAFFWSRNTLNFFSLRKLALGGLLSAALLFTCPLEAQHLTLEGQTGGFLTPTAYVVYSAKDAGFSHPAIGYHFINASKVIGDIHTFSIVEGYKNRAEVGYTRSVHTLGDSNVTSAGAFSQFWNFDGMNIFSGKVVAIKDGQFGPAIDRKSVV